MAIRKQIIYLIYILISINLLGCGPEKEESAEDIAIIFFSAVYNEKDLDKVKTLSSPKLKEEIEKYKTVSHLARHFFNMSYDSVEVSAAMADTKIREEFIKLGTLTILFTGTRNNKVYKELKKIKMIKEGTHWYVDELLADPIPK